MAIYITDAISLNMVSEIHSGNFAWVWAKKLEDVKEYFTRHEGNIINGISDPDIAAIVSSDLGVTVKSNRINTMKKGDAIIIAKYVGPRLPEGTKSLPEGAKIKYAFMKVR